MSSAGFLERVGATLLTPRAAIERVVAQAAPGIAIDDAWWLLLAKILVGDTPRLVRAWVAARELGLRSGLTLLSGTLATILPDILLVVAAAITMALVLALLGRRTSLGRTMDLAAAAWVPYFVCQALTAAVYTLAQRVPSAAEHRATQVLAGVWAAGVWALGLRAALAAAPGPGPGPGPGRDGARSRALAGGWALVATLGLLLAANVVYSVRHIEVLGRVGTPLGQPVPDFDLPLLDRADLRARLADGRGVVTVLSFWATWCGPCKAELPELDLLARRLGPSVRMLAINTEGTEATAAVRSFVKERGLALPVALDDGRVASAYGVEVIPHLVIVGPELVARRVFVGSRSATDIARAIEELGPGGRRESR